MTEPAAIRFPRGATDNALLLSGLRRLTAAGKHQAFGLYAVLCVRAMGKGSCYPSTRTLMADTGLPRRTIERYRADLVSVGLIGAGRRKGSSNLYTLPELGRSTATGDGTPVTDGGGTVTDGASKGLADSDNSRQEQELGRSTAKSDGTDKSGGGVPSNLAAQKKRT